MTLLLYEFQEQFMMDNFLINSAQYEKQEVNHFCQDLTRWKRTNVFSSRTTHAKAFSLFFLITFLVLILNLVKNHSSSKLLMLM